MQQAHGARTDPECSLLAARDLLCLVIDSLPHALRFLLGFLLHLLGLVLGPVNRVCAHMPFNKIYARKLVGLCNCCRRLSAYNSTLGSNFMKNLKDNKMVMLK